MPSPEATTPAGVELESVPAAPRPGDPEFIGPLRQTFWTYINPLESELDNIREADLPVEVANDPMAALEVRESQLKNGQRKSAKFIYTKERAGQWLAVKLSARGIATGSFSTLLNLESSIEIAAKIARGEKVNNLTPTVEDMVKAAQAVAVGAKAHAELSETLIKQLAPVKPKDEEDGKPAAPRGPTREQPITAIQAENVYISNPSGDGNPAKNDSITPPATETELQA